MNNLIIILTGPSGSGKSTLERVLKNRGTLPMISATTRLKRPEEVDGQNYYFMDKSRFKRLSEEGAFVEEVEFNGERYGLLKNEVEKFKYLSTPAVIVVEPHGKQQIEEYAKRMNIGTLRIFVDIDAQTQMERLLHRYRNEVNGIGAITRQNVDEFNALTTANAKRLVVASTLEKTWIADAYQREQDSTLFKNYDYVIGGYNHESELLVMRNIELLIKSKLKQQEKEVASIANMDVA